METEYINEPDSLPSHSIFVEHENDLIETPSLSSKLQELENNVEVSDLPNSPLNMKQSMVESTTNNNEIENKVNSNHMDEILNKTPNSVVNIDDIPIKTKMNSNHNFDNEMKTSSILVNSSPMPNKAQPLSSRLSHSAKKNPITPKPFLRKGSRKEPTALNRMKMEKEKGRIGGTPSSSEKSTPSPSSKPSSSIKSKFNMNNARNTKADNNFDTIPVEIKAPKQTRPHLQSQSPPLHLLQSNDEDNDAGLWEERTREALHELQEFELLEQQVDALDVPTIQVPQNTNINTDFLPKYTQKQHHSDSINENLSSSVTASIDTSSGDNDWLRAVETKLRADTDEYIARSPPRNKNLHKNTTDVINSATETVAEGYIDFMDNNINATTATNVDDTNMKIDMDMTRQVSEIENNLDYELEHDMAQLSSTVTEMDMEIRDNTFGGNGARVNQGHRQRPQQPGYRPALGRLDSSKVGGGSGRDMASAMTWSSVAGAMDSNPNTNSNSSMKANNRPAGRGQTASSAVGGNRSSTATGPTARSKARNRHASARDNGRSRQQVQTPVIDEHNYDYDADAADLSETLNLRLAQKAEQLERELDIYKKENSSIKQLKRQQESTLNETIKERQEVLRWIADEKERVEQWCREQRQAAIRERRTAAKYARDIRNKAANNYDADGNTDGSVGTGGGIGMGVRRERHEMELLRQELEKVRADYDIFKRKARANDRRLQQVIKEQTKTIDSSRAQAEAAEKEKDRIWNTLSKVPAGKNLLKLIRKPGSEVRKSINVNSDTSTNTQSQSEEMFFHRYDYKSSNGNEDTQVDSDVEEYYSNEPISTHTGVDSNAADDLEYMNQVGYTEDEGKHGGDNYLRTRKGKLAGAIFDADIQERNHFQRRSTERIWGETSYNNSEHDQGVVHQAAVKSDASAGNKVMNERTSLEQDGRQETVVIEEDDGTELDGEGRQEKTLADGRKVITYRNGTIKELFTDGKCLVRYVNGDTMLKDPITAMVVYYYAQADTTHTTHKDGTNVYEFPNKQVETHFPDGTKDIAFPDSTRKLIHPDGLQESIFPDGVVVREYADGEREIISP